MVLAVSQMELSPEWRATKFFNPFDVTGTHEALISGQYKPRAPIDRFDRALSGAPQLKGTPDRGYFGSIRLKNASQVPIFRV